MCFTHPVHTALACSPAAAAITWRTSGIWSTYIQTSNSLCGAPTSTIPQSTSPLLSCPALPSLLLSLLLLIPAAPAPLLLTCPSYIEVCVMQVTPLPC